MTNNTPIPLLFPLLTPLLPMPHAHTHSSLPLLISLGHKTIPVLTHQGPYKDLVLHSSSLYFTSMPCVTAMYLVHITIG